MNRLIVFVFSLLHCQVKAHFAFGFVINSILFLSCMLNNKGLVALEALAAWEVLVALEALVASEALVA